MRKSIIWIAVIAMAGVNPMSLADQIIMDDLIVDGSCCVGDGCELNEEFAFDTLRLKGEILRLGFTDTSSSAAFPTNDWQITINDADGDGDANHFSIEDIDRGTTPFTIEAGAPDYSVFVKANGQVGIGTRTPDPGVALDVRGSLRVDGAIDATGSAIGLTGVKAGILPKSDFSWRRGSVRFDIPYEQDYLIMLTAVSWSSRWTYKPTVTAQNSNGFTVDIGGRPWGLKEVHWMTQVVGE